MPSWSVAAQALSPACGSAWPPRRRTVTRSASRCTGSAASTRSASKRSHCGEVLVVTDARRREVYWARYRDGVRVDGPAVNAPADVPGRRRRGRRSPEHAALFDLPRLRPSTRRRRASCAPWPTGRPSRRRWFRCICAAPTPSRGPSSRRRPDDGGARSADPRRRRAVRRAGGAAVRRRRPVARPRIRGRARSQAQSLRRRARRRQAGRLRRHRAAGPQAALRVRDPHHRRRPRLPGPGHRPSVADRAARISPMAERFSSRSEPTTRRRSPCTRAWDSSESACADGTTEPAAPTPTPCDGIRHDDHPGHRKLLRRNRCRHRAAR